MNDSDPPSSARLDRPAWNKGKLTGPKPPLRPGHVWSIRAKLQLERCTRDLTMFNLAIDSKLRGCDLVALRVDDVAPNGYAVDRATVRQRKTGRPVRFELTEVTRQALDDYIRSSGRKHGQCLFPGRRGPRSADDNAAVCAARVRVDQRHRPRPPKIRNAFDAQDQGDFDLSSHGQFARGSTFVGPPPHRKYRALPWRRGRRCPRYCRDDRGLKYLGRAAVLCPPGLPVKRVESKMGAVAWGLWPSPRFPSPLIEP
jgi:hypothetical protein